MMRIDGNVNTTQEYYDNIQRHFNEKVTADQGSNESFLTENNVAATLSISALSAEEFEKTRQSWHNYHVSYLYRTDLSMTKNSEGKYKIGGADFSEEEFASAKNLIGGVSSQLKTGYLSYRDYANMELAENIVDKFASSVFNEEQVKAINKAMRDYNENIIKHQNDLLSKREVEENDDPNSGKYFGTQIVLSKQEQESISSALGKTINVTTAGTDIATNREKIEEVRNIIKAIDVTEYAATDSLMKMYREVMKPVYMTQYPFQREKTAENTVNGDVNHMIGMINYAKQWLEIRG